MSASGSASPAHSAATWTAATRGEHIMTQSDEHDPALARVQPGRQPAGLPAVRGQRPPRLAVHLDPPQEAQALLGSVKDDYAALQAQVENAYQERLRAVHQRFNRGDMTPNETAAALQAASHE